MHELLARALDLPEDAAEAAVLVDRLKQPPPGREVLAVGDDTAVAMMSIRTDEPAVGYLDLFAVDVPHRRAGRGRGLLASAEQELAARGVTEVRVVGNAPCYAWPGVDVRYTAAACLLEATGYENTGGAINMTVDLATAPLDTEVEEAALADVGVSVRRAGPSDAVGEWAADVFSPGWGWESSHARGVHVALRDGRILGFAAWGANRPSWFGPMGTAEESRGLGIGAILLKRCLADQRELGLGSAQIGWVGPRAFYSKAVGARVERVFWQYRKAL